MKTRRAGVLLPILSLQTPHGIGDFGPAAFRWIDWLREQRQTVWQILPLNIIQQVTGYSPYSSISAYAISPFFLSPDDLLAQGYLSSDQITFFAGDETSDGVHYDFVERQKSLYLKWAYQGFCLRPEKRDSFNQFCQNQAFWLDDFSLFMALREQFGLRSWIEWPEEYARRNPEALARFARESSVCLEEIKFQQYILSEQWQKVKSYAESRGVLIFGDMPIYVEFDSADVWSNPKSFELGRNLLPKVVAGVPPDYFSETGQRWGNPVYNWKVMKADGYAWWIRRLRYNLSLYDYVRIDHFRGLVQYWQVPVKETTAIHGRWKKVPVFSFLKALRTQIPDMPIIAEDLGIITDDVKAVMKRYQLPGMKILLFAFGGDLTDHPYLPHNFYSRNLVYTGTHDNNTVLGWFHDEAQEHEKRNLSKYIQRNIDDRRVHWDFIELAYFSPANWAIIPLQDLLAMGGDARMNKPGTVEGNWRWQMKDDLLTPELGQDLRRLVCRAQRGGDRE